MRLRHVLLIMSTVGTIGALLLGADLYRRMIDAENLHSLHSTTPGPDSVVQFGSVYVLGFLALAFLLLAVVIGLISALSDPRFAAMLDGDAPPPREKSAESAVQLPTLLPPGAAASGAGLPVPHARVSLAGDPAPAPPPVTGPPLADVGLPVSLGDTAVLPAVTVPPPLPAASSTITRPPPLAEPSDKPPVDDLLKEPPTEPS